MTKKILILCTGNSCRSQIAEGYLRKFSINKAVIYSAGIEAHGVNKHAIETMLEDQIDISSHTSNLLSDYFSVDFDYIITVCDHAKENCPYFTSNAKRFHCNFPDPAKAIGTEKEMKANFRRVRDQIKYYCQNFVENHLFENIDKTK